MDKKIYCCFSVPLKNFLKEKGVNYDMCALNEKTHKTMWLYVRDEKLNIALTEWSLNKS